MGTELVQFIFNLFLVGFFFLILFLWFLKCHGFYTESLRALLEVTRTNLGIEAIILGSILK